MKKSRTEDLQVAQFELWKDMFIAGLALIGVPQLEISKVVRIDLNRVNRIAKSLNKRKKRNTGDKNA